MLVVCACALPVGKSDKFAGNFVNFGGNFVDFGGNFVSFGGNFVSSDGGLAGYGGDRAVLTASIPCIMLKGPL